MKKFFPVFFILLVALFSGCIVPNISVDVDTPEDIINDYIQSLATEDASTLETIMDVSVSFNGKDYTKEELANIYNFLFALFEIDDVDLWEYNIGYSSGMFNITMLYSMRYTNLTGTTNTKIFSVVLKAIKEGNEIKIFEITENDISETTNTPTWLADEYIQSLVDEDTVRLGNITGDPIIHNGNEKTKSAFILEYANGFILVQFTSIDVLSETVEKTENGYTITLLYSSEAMVLGNPNTGLTRTTIEAEMDGSNLKMVNLTDEAVSE